MKASVVVRTKDEADRLRLVLTSLGAQTEPAQIVVVNDGSSDHTKAVIEAAAATMQVVGVHHAQPAGRSGAANAGARRADGEVLIFLDGDTLAAPDWVARHMAIHRRRGDVVARGETFHLRCTRFFADPQTGSPMPGEESRIQRTPAAEITRMRVTASAILNDFASVDARAQPGLYPGAGPRQLFELEMRALREDPSCRALWAAASGANQSVNACAFRDAGGFDDALNINEHRELALRLCKAGLSMVPADGAKTYHMTHRSGWRDPLANSDWERRFYGAHPIPEVALLSVLWASLSAPSPIAPAAQITSLKDLADAAARRPAHPDPQAVRDAHIAETVARAGIT